MATCKQCGERLSVFEGLGAGLCARCVAENLAAAQKLRDKSWAESAVPADLEQVASAERDELTVRLASIVLTTESACNLPIAERLDIVTAEVVIGMHLFKDIAAAWSDAFGGRSKTMQDGLRQARKTALDELRREALALGADAVVAVDLDYSEISGGGKSMLFLVASGTAVRLSA